MKAVDLYAKRIRDCMPELRREYSVKTLGLFGSVARGEDNHRSDLDILVEFKEPISLIHFISLERKLSRITGKKTDLVMKSALKPNLGKNILREVQYV